MKKKKGFLDFMDEHKAETAMIVTGVLGMIAGVVVGIDIGKERVMRDVVEKHMACLDIFGRSGFIATMNSIQDHVPEAADMVEKFLEENPGGLGVREEFFNDPAVREFRTLFCKK